MVHKGQRILISYSLLLQLTATTAHYYAYYRALFSLYVSLMREYYHYARYCALRVIGLRAVCVCVSLLAYR
jgi:hypothetical protein